MSQYEHGRFVMRVQRNKGGSVLVALDEITGNVLPGGRILQINTDGTLTRFQGVRRDLGLSLDKHGCIESGRLLTAVAAH